MENIHSEVEDFIEETYLSNLSKEKLLQNLERFSHICGKAIAETITDPNTLRTLNSKLKALRDDQLAEDPLEELEFFSIDDSELSSIEAYNRRKIKKIIANKRLIIQMIRELSPVTARQIENENASSFHNRSNQRIPIASRVIPRSRQLPPAPLRLLKSEDHIELEEDRIKRSFSLIFGFMSFCLALVICALLVSL
jgi:hypothetical protein